MTSDTRPTCEACGAREATGHAHAVRTATVGQLRARVARPLRVCEPCRLRLDGDYGDDDETPDTERSRE